LAQQALVQLAEALHFPSTHPCSAQQTQSAHDVQSHNGQSDGQQQQPADNVAVAVSPVAASPIDRPATIVTITSSAATTAA
jgi:hypothetical protein